VRITTKEMKACICIYLGLAVDVKNGELGGFKVMSLTG